MVRNCYRHIYTGHYSVCVSPALLIVIYISILVVCVVYVYDVHQSSLLVHRHLSHAFEFFHPNCFLVAS